MGKESKIEKFYSNKHNVEKDLKDRDYNKI